MYRTLLGLFACVAVALALVGLSFSSTSSEPPDFRFVNGTEPATLDPHLLTGQPGGRVALAVFEGLTRLDAKSLQPSPGVAESWEISEDQTRYTFKLRKDARWSDGKPVTAHDFTYSFSRALSPKTGSEYAYILYMMRHAEALNTFAGRASSLTGKVAAALTKLQEGVIDEKAWQSFLSEQQVHDLVKGTSSKALRSLIELKDRAPNASELRQLGDALKVEADRLSAALALAERHFGKDQGVYAVSDYELVIELNAPTAYFLEIMAFYTAMPVPRWIVEKEGNANNWFLPEKIVSNGPFRLEEWSVNDRIRMVKNEHYWGKDRVSLRHVEALSLENMTTALNLYLTGEVDWLPSDRYPESLVDNLKTRDDFYKGPAWMTYYYRLNTTRPPLNDPKVRRALSLAIDRKTLVEEILGVGQLPAHHFVPPGVAGYERPKSVLGFDPDAARALLKEAGFANGEGIPELGILYNTKESHKRIAEFVADQLRRNLGVRVKAYNQEWQSFLQSSRSLNFDIARASWVGDYLDPNTFLDMWVTNGGNNQTGFTSAKYDRLIAAAANIVEALESLDVLQAAVGDTAKLNSLAAQVADLSGTERADKLSELRLFLLAEAESILLNEGNPIIPVYFYTISGMVSPRVGGFYNTLTLSDGSEAANLTDKHPLDALRVHTRRAE